MQSDQIKVVCGDWDYSTDAETMPSQERNVTDIDVHPVFYSKALWNDFALLHLQSDFEIKPHINVICLPSSSDFSDFDTNNCKAAGWGKDAAGKKNQAFFEFELQ